MGHDTATLRVDFESGRAKGGEAASRRARRRRIPGLDSLENRICLSTMTPTIAARHGQQVEVILNTLPDLVGAQVLLATHPDPSAGRLRPWESTIYLA